jgi:hypothetical protein
MVRDTRKNYLWRYVNQALQWMNIAENYNFPITFGKRPSHRISTVAVKYFIGCM